MKSLLCCVVLMAFVHTGHSQTWDEWFRQKKTQKKYLLQQIAALQVYLGYVKDGYGIARKGLSTIGSIKDGDLKQHDAFFTSLSNVNAKIAGYPRVGDITRLQREIVERAATDKKRVHGNGNFSPGEMTYVDGVFGRLLNDGAATLDELQQVITPGKLQLSDDERIKRIDRLFDETVSQHGFSQKFAGDLAGLAEERARSKLESSRMKSLQGIH